ncbi:unnamed protein product [Symbiodinium natans]|uniref:Uncharacterized protein n=1 Tax=Symbiodinium natans TaxID=878477 RepID=A0A812TUN5_9DINO|nr:unnamed protein product [Symbiodinium natans]
MSQHVAEALQRVPASDVAVHRVPIDAAPVFLSVAEDAAMVFCGCFAREKEPAAQSVCSVSKGRHQGGLVVPDVDTRIRFVPAMPCRVRRVECSLDVYLRS